MPQNHVILVIAHPDDEIFASGTLCLLAEKGLRITIVAMTDGEGGDAHLLPPQTGLSLASVRQQELRLSASALGASEVLFMGYPDVPPPHGPQPADWNEAEIISRLVQLFRERRPELILTHGPHGGYGHPAHKLTYRYVMSAAAGAGFRGSIFSFCGMVEHSPFSKWCDDRSDVFIDVREFLERRAASLAYHQSQLGFFLQPYFPRTLRDYRSSLLGYLLWFTDFGRKRMPIGTPRRLFRRYPKEGLVLRRRANDPGATFFLERFADDRRVHTVIGPTDAQTPSSRAGLRAARSP